VFDDSFLGVLAAAGREISEEEGANSLSFLLPVCGLTCVGVVVRLNLVTSSSSMLCGGAWTVVVEHARLRCTTSLPTTTS